jgi:hypothetical protein
MTKEEKYKSVYKTMCEQGFILLTDLPKLIGTKSLISIRIKFESFGLFTYDDELTDEEKKLFDKTPHKPYVLRPTLPMYAKWIDENKEKPKKSGHIRTGERGTFK